ncbi:chromatin binding protein [Zalerion maritima]|uniref:Chromatin binding protein n=1 Tax=Zalerion maritima TaxID=339359 RepID=A0AAD5RWM9_9PEZI|nr:chromatin binding protein [Zalerion maritima]
MDPEPFKLQPARLNPEAAHLHKVAANFRLDPNNPNFEQNLKKAAAKSSNKFPIPQEHLTGMNLLLSDDYLIQDHPEVLNHTIRSGHSTCLRFNRKGNYLASGRVDGTVVLWDMDTMGVARKLRGHSKGISSLCWSRCGRYLLSACRGWLVILWDLQDGKKERQIRVRAPVFTAELNPTNRHQIIVACYEEDFIYCDAMNKLSRKYVLPSAPKRDDSEVDEATKEKWAKEDAKTMTTAAIFTPSGKHILAGTNKGRVNVINSNTREIIYSEKVCTGVITSLRVSFNGSDLLINAQDRIIRTFKLPELDVPDLDPDTIQLNLEHKFQDVVNRLSWNACCFGATGEYVAASTYNNHEMYIWERTHGSLVRMLEGPKEEQGMVEWHPSKPILAVNGLETGRIYIWGVTNTQKWSSLAPDFAEVEENDEYEEKEDEFDIHPQEEIAKRRIDREDEEDVDVLTMDVPKGDEQEFRMPILYNLGDDDSEEELIAVSTGTMRRKSYSEGQGDVSLDGETIGEGAAGGPSAGPAEKATAKKGKGKGKKK